MGVSETWLAVSKHWKILEGMSVRTKDLVVFTALAALPTSIALAQPAAQAPKPAAAQSRPPVAQPLPTQQQPTNPAVQAAPQQGVPQPQAAPPPPPPPPPPVWTPADANQLLLSILTSGNEGLDAKDYDAAGLITAMNQVKTPSNTIPRSRPNNNRRIVKPTCLAIR